MQITWFAVVKPEPAESPKAMLLLPLVLLKSDLSPMAVLKEPMLFLKSENTPFAVLPLPLLRKGEALLNSAPAPVAVFSLRWYCVTAPPADRRVKVAVIVFPE
jgi:hypothetical protein